MSKSISAIIVALLVLAGCSAAPHPGSIDPQPDAAVTPDPVDDAASKRADAAVDSGDTNFIESVSCHGSVVVHDVNSTWNGYKVPWTWDYVATSATYGTYSAMITLGCNLPGECQSLVDAPFDPSWFDNGAGLQALTIGNIDDRWHLYYDSVLNELHVVDKLGEADTAFCTVTRRW